MPSEVHSLRVSGNDPLTLIRDLKTKIGCRVTVAGWIYHNRPGGKVLFLVIRDGTGLCQCVVENQKIGNELFEGLRRLGAESSLEIEGVVRADDRSPGGCELSVTGARVIHEAVDYPITPKSHGVDFLLRHRHMHLRSQRPWALGKIRHTVIDTVRRFFNDNGFVLVDTPILTPVAGEESDNLFKVDYFGSQLVLTQTGQLYLEAAAAAYGRAYCFGPTFRAEKSKTRRHLAEFWMVEPELAFTNLEGLLDLAEGLVSSIAAEVLSVNINELRILEIDLEPLAKIRPPFERLTYSQAVDLLRGQRARNLLEAEFEELQRDKGAIQSRIARLEAIDPSPLKKWQKEKNDAELIELRGRLADVQAAAENNPRHAELAANFQWGKDLGGSDESILSRMFDKPVFVTHYPQQAKAFYMKTDRDDQRLVLNFDLLAPGGFGEIIGGSVREDDHDRLLAKIAEKGLNADNYRWYLDLRKYGSVPHGGFGLGIERTVAWLTNQQHIRQCIAFPRMMDRVYM